MNVHGTVDFKENITGAEGNLRLYIYWNGSTSYPTFYGTKSFEGSESINWTWAEIVGSPLNAGSLRQGTHKMLVQATAANGIVTREYQEFTIDNTPKVEILVYEYHETGTFDILGIVEFKEHLGSNEGTLRIDIREANQSTWSYHGTKTYNITNVGWKYSNITGHELDQFVWSAKEIEVKATATANNGAKAVTIKGAIIPALGCAL